MATADDRPDWGLRNVRPGEGFNVLGYLAGMVAAGATAQAWQGNNNDERIFALWALAFAVTSFWSFRMGVRRGAGRPWGVIPILMAFGLISVGRTSLSGWAGWVLGMIALVGTNLIRLVAEGVEYSPLLRPAQRGIRPSVSKTGHGEDSAGPPVT